MINVISVIAACFIADYLSELLMKLFDDVINKK